MTKWEENFARFVFERADKLSPEFFKAFLQWYHSANLRGEIGDDKFFSRKDDAID